MTYCSVLKKKKVSPGGKVWSTGFTLMVISLGICRQMK